MPATGLPVSLPDDLPPLEVLPGPVLADPLPADRPVRWGILATGRIAGSFAANLRLLPDAEIRAVGARTAASAERFAAEHGAARAYGDYRALVEDPDVDVVYVASPHSLHLRHVLMALDAGKPVLCEKSLTLDAAQAEVLVDAARERGLFLMEAMWMRCNPLVRRIAGLLGTGLLGEVRQVRADLGFVVDKPPTDRLWDRALGAGVLLDMGIYPVSLADLLLGEPEQVAAVAALSGGGVDQNLAVSLGYRSGAVAALTASMTAWSPRTASVATELGRFDLPDGFHHPTTATWTSAGEATELREDVIGTGLADEAVEVMRCLRNGETQSPLVPLDVTLRTMRLMDRVRAQVGVVYDADEQPDGPAAAGPR